MATQQNAGQSLEPFLNAHSADQNSTPNMPTSSAGDAGGEILVATRSQRRKLVKVEAVDVFAFLTASSNSC